MAFDLVVFIQVVFIHNLQFWYNIERDNIYCSLYVRVYCTGKLFLYELVDVSVTHSGKNFTCRTDSNPKWIALYSVRIAYTVPFFVKYLNVLATSFAHNDKTI